jgi:hypothetical protein
MKDFSGKIAIVTGGGSGIGRELVRQLAAQGCHVATCDVSQRNVEETVRLCEADQLPQGARVTAHVADVSDEQQLERFREDLTRKHDTDKAHLLFNNAGIGGGGSMLTDDRSEWERTFSVTWGGVYLGTRVFLPLLVKADEGHIVNVSSVNGFFASIGPNRPHTAYSAAKFAVKGFTEALITDLRINAPHIHCSVVMPGHIGTNIVANSRKVLARTESDEMSAQEMAQARLRLRQQGIDDKALTDEQVAAGVAAMAAAFRDLAPTSAAQAATVILDGVKAQKWRILVGEDARVLDERVRANPEHVYDLDFDPGFGIRLE